MIDCVFHCYCLVIRLFNVWSVWHDVRYGKVVEGGSRVGAEPTIRLHVCCCDITKYICFVIFSFAPYCLQAGNAALLLALIAGHDDAAAKLIENGADVSCKYKVVRLCVGRRLVLV